MDAVSASSASVSGHEKEVTPPRHVLREADVRVEARPFRELTEAFAGAIGTRVGSAGKVNRSHRPEVLLWRLSSMGALKQAQQISAKFV
jgi:hypothetical protein